jgi:ornithine decarboxylase
MENFKSVCDYLKNAQPSDPVICHRPHAAARSARWFLQYFPGEVLYAVKANPSPLIIRSLYEAGIRHFDVSSPAEIELFSQYSDVRLYCMNPVKHPEHIRSAYFDYGVRDFALDTPDELNKILAATNHATDLGLHVRLAVDNSSARLPLDSKYGVCTAEAPQLLMAARLRAEALGVCFHVGSQSMAPHSYASAIETANRMIQKSGVILDSLDVGGGFPAAYPGLEPAPLSDYMAVIDQAFNNSLTSETCTLLCEPGRALVAESASGLVNVTLRKGDCLYLNDGAYGALFDAAHMKFPYPLRTVRNGEILASDQNTPFRFFGPTCDSIDYMPGPFLLPADIQAGDYIEIGQLGAYGDVMRTDFNGFGKRQEIIVTDEPIMSLYSAPGEQPMMAERNN